MTNPEFSNEFDILYNNIASNQAPGLDEYEKSVFLTTAQEGLVLDLINGNNQLDNSFEKTEEVRRYLSDLVKTTEMSKYDGTDIIKLTSKSVIYDVPEDLWFTTYENVVLKDDDLLCAPYENIEVVPVTQDEFSRIIKNPFRRPTPNRVLRLDVGGKIELVSDYTIESYIIRYVKVLEPIILTTLPNGLTIKGKSNETICKLNPGLHRAILETAVNLAKASMGLIESGK